MSELPNRWEERVQDCGSGGRCYFVRLGWFYVNKFNRMWFYGQVPPAASTVPDGDSEAQNPENPRA